MKRCMTRTTANADLATENMWKSVSPEPYEFTDKPRWWEGVQEEINEMHDGGQSHTNSRTNHVGGKEFRKKSMKCTTVGSIMKNGTHQHTDYSVTGVLHMELSNKYT